jgi:hypothetical protein
MVSSGRYRLTALVGVAILAGCAVPHVPSRIVYEDRTSFVRLERDPHVQTDRPETRHTHPVEIAPDEIAAMLRGIRVQQHRLALHAWIAGQAPMEPAFTDAEVELLASSLSDALAKAAPEERVTYYFSYPHTALSDPYGLRKRLVTSGALYVEGSRVHFTLSNYRAIYGVPPYGMIYDRRYPALPIVPKGFDVFFEPADAVVPKRFSLWEAVWGYKRDDVVIDRSRLRKHLSVVRSTWAEQGSDAP